MFTIKVDTSKVVRRIEGIEKRIETLMPSIENEVKSILRDAFAKIFAAEGIPRWRKLSPYTIRDRIAKGFGPGPILQRTGKLKRSYTGESRYGVWKTNRNSLTYTNLVPYAAFHERGTTRIPARHIIKGVLAKKEVRRAIVNAAHKQILKGGR